MICGRPATRKGIELWENLQREPHGLSRTEQVANLAAAFFAPVRVVGELIGQRFYMPPPYRENLYTPTIAKINYRTQSKRTD